MTTSEEHERDMWDAINAQAVTRADGNDAVPTARTKRGERVVVLTRPSTTT